MHMEHLFLCLFVQLLQNRFLHLMNVVQDSLAYDKSKIQMHHIVVSVKYKPSGNKRSR